MKAELFTFEKSEVCTLPPINIKDGVIKAGMSTRNGGMSHSPYATLNFGYHVGDDPKSVTANRRHLGHIINVQPEYWIAGEQVHGNRVACVTTKDAGRGALDYETVIPDVDGLITSDPNVLLTACYADCTPLYFWSTECPVVGIAHAGWKGTVEEIAAVMVERIQKDFGIMPKDLSVAIGPSIGTCCYEVDEKVAEQVKAISEIDVEKVLVLKENGHYMLNLQLLNTLILEKSGVEKNNIHTTTLCTSCHTDLFFSHRKEGGPTGRMLSYIGIFSGD